MTSLCRDCLAEQARSRRCAACGSPRLVALDEGEGLAIAHVDCDAFYAAVEKRDDPSLRDQPVIVGGGRRGVVATACYIARIQGVRSAMPMFKALEACPEAVVLRPDMEKYARVGRQVRAMMLELTPLVEPVSIDEAFLDLSGTERVHGASPAVVLARFAARVEREVGISVSVGLSDTKFLAKIASDLDKPRGFTILDRARAQAFLGERPVTILPGIGQAAAERLATLGIRRVGDLARADPARLHGMLGRDAGRLLALSRGEDARAVRSEREAKGVSAETTLPEDVAGFDSLRPILWRQCERVSERLKRSGLAGASVTLKLKDRAFRLRTRTRGGLAPTQLAARLFAEGEAMLREACDGTPYRLVGIGAGELCDAVHADRGDLVDAGTVEAARREAALDRVRARFGPGAIQRGLAFTGGAPNPGPGRSEPRR
ncbi:MULTISPECIES: DNA polymerase IV [Methylobacterium]|uniref:DNA polymerase IV n=4 Tax=Pseudomonadota TaxID=1224 RepID=A0ABQ4T2I5_9HYPH|nr:MULTISPECIES: DNA polymerase IV [Methylobacterium]PIU14382.1 MAG: DNA polymerase IV [Methylobacterium sp. CG08_land_8_20_14_0_20_71_15]GBU17951.1 DNA polymerase IV [Methylobacterium sp.]GJE08478.1 DNA polymerase IV [Methylobacterium jeotgali]